MRDEMPESGPHSCNPRVRCTHHRRCTHRQHPHGKRTQNAAKPGLKLRATLTGLEPATSAVTGRHANQLRYRALRIELSRVVQ